MRNIVIVMGYPGSGKTTVSQPLLDQGYRRLNRDTEGGTLDGLLPKLETILRDSQDSVVLDNTYVTAKSRAGVIALGLKYGVPVVVYAMGTSIEDTQVNVCTRMKEGG